MTSAEMHTLSTLRRAIYGSLFRDLLHFTDHDCNVLSCKDKMSLLFNENFRAAY